MAVEAVIDTNVLYAGLYSSLGVSFELLRAIEQKRLVPVLSTTLVFEYEEILRRNQSVLQLDGDAIADILDGLCSRGKAYRVHFLWRPQLRDPKDDHILELAFSAGAAIATFNVKDFDTARRFGIRVVQPSRLLEELR